MATITLRVPDDGVGGAAFDYAVYLAAKLYEDAVVTAGQAAEIAGVSKRTFIELLGKYGVSMFSTDKKDLLADIENA